MLPSQAYANPEEEALKHLGKAVYKEFEVGKAIKRIEKRYVPEEWRPYLGYTGTLVRVATEQKVTFTWEF